MKNMCGECGNRFDNVTMHWSLSDCSYPDISSHQMEVIDGCLLGDGSIDMGSGHTCRFTIDTVEPDFTEHLLSVMGEVGCSSRMIRTGEEQAEYSSGGLRSGNRENYSDVYRFTSIAHPRLNTVREMWYGSSKKKWPGQLEITPTRLKYWYCGDGSYSGNPKSISISSVLMADDVDRITELFKTGNLIKPHYYVNDRDDRGKELEMQFTVGETQELFEYMGDPPPGFEYKWPEEYK